MAEDTGELWKHIGDLHRKHAELHMAVHDRGNEEMYGTMKELLAAIKELTAVMREDVEADKAVARGERKE